uniref:Uncharacterized protein n=1 Tax=Glossina austeni TaxID=7395 RepID=A0A1A9VB61_GLOAU
MDICVSIKLLDVKKSSTVFELFIASVENVKKICSAVIVAGNFNSKSPEAHSKKSDRRGIAVNEMVASLDLGLPYKIIAKKVERVKLILKVAIWTQTTVEELFPATERQQRIIVELKVVLTEERELQREKSEQHVEDSTKRNNTTD